MSTSASLKFFFSPLVRRSPRPITTAIIERTKGIAEERGKSSESPDGEIGRISIQRLTFRVDKADAVRFRFNHQQFLFN